VNHQLVIPPLFFAIAFVFSMLGMGGGQIFIPLLYWSGLDFKSQAVPLGMLLSVVNSGTAAVTYARRRLIDWRIGLLFGVTMLAAAPLGVLVNTVAPTRLLVLSFAFFTAASGVVILVSHRPEHAMGRRRRTVLGLLGGGGLGFIAGLLGRGGGSFVVPLLTLAGLDARTAAATSSLAVTFSGVSSFTAHLATAARPDWSLWLSSAAAVLLGSRLGSRVMAVRLRPRAVKRVFAGVLFLVALLLVFEDLYR